ncbi:hypothetical protein BV20DRAFT_980728 [Pilatotrama ljubarskyi]|nr:hypothetical protein BV20DRAFT_980728 [Pilatotrama ljubarskyi]
MKSDVGTLEDLLKANAAHIAELKERVALLEGKLLLKSSVEEDSKGAVTSSLHARSAASTMIDLKTVASLTAGTRDQPWELSDSDDEQKGSKASTSASHSAKAALVEPSSRNIDADVIESTVSDSEFMLAEQENVPVTNMRKRGRAGSLPSLGAPSSVSIGESAGLSASSSRKHRKLNHADDPDMKPFSGGPKSEHVESVLPDIEPVHHTRTKKYANLLPESHLKVEEKVDQVHETSTKLHWPNWRMFVCLIQAQAFH